MLHDTSVENGLNRGVSYMALTIKKATEATNVIDSLEGSEESRS